MFLSYEYLGYKGLDPKTNEHRWEYRIVDSEWKAVVARANVVVSIVDSSPLEVTLVGLAVVQEYSKRSLPVAANLIRVFRFISTKYGFSIQQIIDWNKQYNPQYKQYEQEIERYLVLL